MTWWKSVLNLNAIDMSAEELLRFQYLTNDLECHVTCCAQLWDNLHQVWPYPFLNYCIFWCWYVISCCDLDLWLVDLKVCRTSNVTWSKSVRNMSEIKQSPAELLIILRIFVHVMSCCDLDPWSIVYYCCCYCCSQSFKSRASAVQWWDSRWE